MSAGRARGPAWNHQDEIPLSARMCALAYVSDASTIPRPYKKEISPEDASRLIIGASGSLLTRSLKSLRHSSPFLNVKKNV